MQKSTKKSFFIFMGTLLLVGCTPSEDLPSPDVSYDPHAMSGMPCHQMGGVYMGDCQFDAEGNLIEENDHDQMMPFNSRDTFSQNAENLPEAKPSEAVELKDGDVYQMEAGLVKQEVGNRLIKRLAYNGQIPGPLLKVDQGAEITLEFKNNLDVETTLHSHGLRLDNAFDGVPDSTQKTIQPGESFTYTLKFPDAGIYWYHPHVREDYTQELGLYGNMLVEPSESDYWSPVNREVNWIVDDMLINSSEPAFDKETTNYSLMGRFGNVLLLNNEEDYTLNAKKGEVFRFYLTNVANTRVFNLGIDGVQTKLVGGDIGRAEKEVLQNFFLLAPAERVVFEVKFDQEGTFDIVHQTPERTYTLGKIVVSGAGESMGDFEELRDNASDFEEVRKDMESLLEKDPDQSLRLSIEMGNMTMVMGGVHQDEGIEWEDTMRAMNAVSNSNTTEWKLIDEETGRENMDIDWSFKQGDLVKVRLFNDSHSMHPMQHPIHFHGQRFVILSRNGVANENLQWKDTALIQTGETVDLLVEMSNPGTWMAHCHIAEHLHSGMMFSFEVN